MFSSIPIKTKGQIKSMEKGGAILHEVLQKVAEAVKPGVSTYELDKMAEELILSHKGAKPGFKGYRGFPATLCTSVNEEVVHGIPKKDVLLRDGDIIGIDCGVIYDGLYTDSAVTVMVGEMDPEVGHFVKTTKKALNNALKQVKPGGYIGDISATIQKTLEDQGYGAVVECTGHGVGKELHEPPEILNVGKKGTGPQMKPGMTFAIEPISSLESGNIKTASDGWTVVTSERCLSAHFEHTILVTDSGHKILT